MTAYPMAVEQQSIWLDEALNDGPSRYLESWVYRLTGAVDMPGVDWAYRQLLHRHEGLRSRYVLDDEDLVQQVRPGGDVPGLTHRPCAAADLDDELRRLVNRPMDLADGPVRGTLLRLADDDVVVVLQLHHIVVDDWALHLLERDFQESYRAWVEHRPIALPAAPQPGPYAQAQGRLRATAEVRSYWRQRLADPPADAVRAPASDGSGGEGRVWFELGSPVPACRALRATPFVLVAAATAALLTDGAGPSDVLLGAAVSGRGTGETDRMVACLSQVFPLRLRVDPDRSLAELAADVRREVLAMMAHQEIPVADLNRLLRRPGAEAAPPIRTVLVLDDDAGGMDLPGVTAERLFLPSGAAKYDLLLTVVARPGGYRGFLDHAAGRLAPDAARRLTDRLAALIRAAAGDPHGPLKGVLPG
jgi:hypothetical protein